jgi:pyrroloquinoline-quinone synthase
MLSCPTSYLETIDAQVARQSLLLHPFYQCWTRGELSAAALRDYAAQYYHHVAAFPTYLSALHSHTSDQAVRRSILSNLIDEEAGSPNHPELWLNFAASLGVSASAAKDAELWDETRNLIDTFKTICRDRTVEEGLAALYAYESQIPAVSESKIDGLQKHYGVNSEEGLAYFKVHIEADREHSRVERNLLENSLTDRNAAAASSTVNDALDALWEMLSGVCRRHQIAC